MKMKGDEFKIILEDINEKFDTLIEGHHSLNEQLERDREENRVEHKELRDEILLLRKDLNDHRNNTELHAIRKKKKAS
jgi:hypothetical protein